MWYNNHIFILTFHSFSTVFSGIWFNLMQFTLTRLCWQVTRRIFFLSNQATGNKFKWQANNKFWYDIRFNHCYYCGWVRQTLDVNTLTNTQSEGDHAQIKLWTIMCRAFPHDDEPSIQFVNFVAFQQKKS